MIISLTYAVSWEKRVYSITSHIYTLYIINAHTSYISNTQVISSCCQSTFLKARSKATHLAFDPQIIPLAYCTPSLMTAGWMGVLPDPPKLYMQNENFKKKKIVVLQTSQCKVVVSWMGLAVASCLHMQPMNKGGKFLAKLWCCILSEEKEGVSIQFGFINWVDKYIWIRLWLNMNKADILRSISPLSEQQWRNKAWNVKG